MMIITNDEVGVDVNIYLPFMKALIKKYGNFKVSQDLHNMIIEKLISICREIEQSKRNEDAKN